MRSFNALPAAPTAWSLLLTRKTTPRLKIKQHNSLTADQPLTQVQQLRRGKALEDSFLKSSSRHVPLEVLRVISAAVVIVAFVVQEGRNIV